MVVKLRWRVSMLEMKGDYMAAKKATKALRKGRGSKNNSKTKPSAIARKIRRAGLKKQGES